MRFAYEIKNGCAVVRRCYDFGNEAEIPSEIDGHPVTELGAYAFSAHMDREQFWHELGNRTVKIWNPETGEQEVSEPDAETVPGLQGMQVETCRRAFVKSERMPSIIVTHYRSYISTAV